VYYPHGVWWPNWAGETVVFNADKSDIIAAVYPKPNRMVVFPGCLPHVARGVSRTCPELRIVLVFKTEVRS
jgi:SM-20-related protein